MWHKENILKDTAVRTSGDYEVFSTARRQTHRRAISKFKFCFRRQSPRPKQAHFYQLMKDGIILQEAFS